MRVTRLLSILVLSALSPLVACKSDVEVRAEADRRAQALAVEAKAAVPKPKTAPPAVPSAHLKESLNRIQNSLKARIVPGPALISVERLQSILPTEIGGMTRVELKGDQLTPAGLRVTKASAQFDDAPASIRITISDLVPRLRNVIRV